MNIQETLELVRKAQSLPNDAIAKAAGWLQSGTATSGLTFYDLEAPAKSLYPVLTPLRNSIPRVSGGAGIQANWRVISGINTTGVRLGVSEGNRGAATTHTMADKLAAFRGFGLEDFVNFEADYAAKGFDDAKARAVEALLRSTMIAEEGVILGGNTSLDLGTTGVCPTPTVVLNTDSVSAVTNGTLLVKAVALGWHAYWALAGLNNGTVGSSLGLVLDPNDYAVFTKANTDGSSDTYNGNMSAISSASSGVTIDGTHKSALASVAAVPGAFGYAWYTNANAAGYFLAAITTLNSYNVIADASTTIVPGANLSTRHDKCSLEFDGLLTQALAPASGAYVATLATGTGGTGTKLTTNSAGGITQIDTMCQDRWNLYRLSINELWVNGQQLLDLNTLIIKNGGAPLIRFNLDGASPSTAIDAGTVIGSLLNVITNTKMAIKVHPNMPPGVILGRCTELPYKLSGVAEVCRMLLRQDYYQVEWPRRSRKYEYGVYFDGVLQNYFPPSLAVITNIAPGV